MSLNHALLHSRPRYPGLVNEKITGFSPASIAGLLLWLDAKSITGLSNDDKVSQWNDLSGNNHHAVQANSTYQPVYSTNVQGTYPAVKFGSGNGVKLVTNSITIDVFTLYVVTKRYARNVEYPIIIEQDDVNTGFQIQSENSQTIFRYVLGAGDRAGSAMVNDTSVIFTFKASATNIYAWINTISQGSQANTSGGTTRTKTITIAEQNGSGNRYEGYIMEIALYGVEHSETDILNILTYLNERWSIY